MWFEAVKLLALLMSCDLIAAQGFYSAVGPTFLNQGQVYRVTVASNGYTPQFSAIIEVAVRNSDKTQKVVQAAKNVTLTKAGSQIIELDTRSFPLGNYNLELKAITGKKFEKFNRLNMNTKKNTILVQTDKAMYKPSDKVQFRVLVVNSVTRPQNPSSVNVVIMDGAQNRVKQFDNVKLTKGVFQGHLQLAELAVLGNWQIIVKLGSGEESIKQFEVAKYTLPTFEMSIDSQTDTYYQQGVIRATVKARYTFGQIAKGNATITATTGRRYYPYYRGGPMPMIADEPIAAPGRPGRRPPPPQPGVTVSKTVVIDGVSFVEFDMEKELQLTDKTRDTSVLLSATFIEELTGREQKAEKRVTIHTSQYKIDLQRKGYQFKPTLPYTVTAVVKNWDRDTPVTDRKGVVFTTKYFYDKLRNCTDTWNNNRTYICREEFSTNSTKRVKLSAGLAVLNVVSKTDTSRIEVIAAYKDVKTTINIDRFESAYKEYIQIKSLTKNPKVNSDLEFNVLSNKRLTGITYQVIAKGDVVVSKYVPGNKKTSIDFSFKPTMAMLPTVSVIAYYLNVDGEIVSDFVSVELGNELRNYVNIGLSKNQTEPGQTVDISVKTLPNSFVGLLGVDQSVLILKSGNDIAKESVFQELMLYDNANQYNSFWNNDIRYEYRYYQDFGSLNSVIITNARPQYEREYIPMYYPPNPVPDQNNPNMPMPPMAKPGLPGRPSAPDSDSRGPESAVEIRKDFPETWLFDTFNFNMRTTSVKLTKKVPDSITSWIITGFALDPATGLGLTNVPSKLTVSKLFFVAASLPYSIKRGEVVTLTFQVYNYLADSQEAEVTLFNSNGEFEFAEVIEDQELSCTVDTDRMKTITVDSQSGVTVSFMIRPLIVGTINIKITATTPVAGDGLEKPLIVEPEGVTQYMNKAILIDLTKTTTFNTNVIIEVPANAVENSTRVEASAIGDILGPTLENLDRLIQIPGGCGEQNMIGFVPNIVAINYLTAVKKLTPDTESRAKQNMEKGYQGQLSYKRTDGSFSAFGMSDPSGSTWLTAYVLKSFKQASVFITIDPAVLTQSYNFLQSVQNADGSFKEPGNVIHKDMQGGSSSGLALTAYTLITFLEDPNTAVTYSNTITKALNYIVANLEKLDDTYAIAITAYALQVAKHPQRAAVLAKLDAKATNKNGMKYWEKPAPASDSGNQRYYGQPNTVNVEMSSYGLQALLLAGRDGDAVSVMRWLVTQRNKEGGFQSTQDTVVGLQGLAKIAAKIYAADSKMDITVSQSFSAATTININQSNALILQKFALPSQARNFAVNAKGNGLTILQIAYQYNVAVLADSPRFTVTPTVTPDSTIQRLHVQVCSSFIPDSNSATSNMAVMEVSFPSGFTFNGDSLGQLQAVEKVKKVEVKKGDTLVVVYFDNMTATPVCPVFQAFRTSNVAFQKPASVVVYDYYDNTRIGRAFYDAPLISPCDICMGAFECNNICFPEEF